MPDNHRRSPLRFLSEIARRFRLAISAPTLQRAGEIEREKAHAERQRLAEEYSEGYLAGWRECYAACLAAVEDELSEKCEIWASGALLTSPEVFDKTN